ncbi:uncharacterized protein CHSO_1122 [Chryseobacterium sp. StRB126]|uniref:hypothetical protein n=1 Tax=Chryseobacterium sp. StRB126 TaxID=878220 RepID=UPI0004E996D7|nr:hypothetical protein [Chryseobacterium sp. StRB126]BAP30159.1 uncharacterized protein CHSO_1122 [Chryseobacterium sp. StRB126]
MKLIPLSDFILEQKRKTTSETDYVKPLKLIFNYAEFLKQPLTLGMFVPVDKHGVVLEPLQFCCTSSDCGCMGMPVNVSAQEEIDEYYEANDKVLLKGVLRVNKTPYKATKRNLIDLVSGEKFMRIYTELTYWTGEIEKQYFDGKNNLKVEDLIKFDLTLTPSALEAIGIKV